MKMLDVYLFVYMLSAMLLVAIIPYPYWIMFFSFYLTLIAKEYLDWRTKDAR